MQKHRFRLSAVYVATVHEPGRCVFRGLFDILRRKYNCVSRFVKIVIVRISCVTTKTIAEHGETVEKLKMLFFPNIFRDYTRYCLSCPPLCTQIELGGAPSIKFVTIQLQFSTRHILFSNISGAYNLCKTIVFFCS